MGAQPQTEATTDGSAPEGVRSEVLFRELNEHIRSLVEGFGLDDEFELMCECTDGGCFEHLTVSIEDYEAVRTVPTRFVVKPGHAADEVERIVQETAHFVVVEKVGADAESAIRFDPRKR